jgi:FkbM family methyltransferase
MNINHLIGSTTSRAWNNLLSWPKFPLSAKIPREIRTWQYDVQCISGSRQFSVIFDVGANVGQTVCGLLPYFKTADIYCFEPVTSAMERLRSRYGSYHNLHFVQCALGRAPGEAEIVLHQNSELNSLVSCDKQPRTADLTGETERIQIATVDEFCAHKQLSHIDIMKIDAQGWELEVLAGASELVRQNQIRFVIAEVGFRKADLDMQHFAALNDFMEANRFWLCGFYDTFYWGQRKEYLGFSNALYMNAQFGR